ncbi:Putative DNA-binding domain-containing protein [Rhodospirillales bacterium URHD0017]|nr:Putative DNA-binding domain-containing protein [Rhodospirillales bacterium URHD0017]
MLRSLRDTQAAFAAHLAGHDRLDLVAAIAGDPRTALQRLQLHRHHVASSIGAALAATFPTVAAVVGQECFGLLARDFTACTSLADPVLSRYGEHFHRFVAAKQDMHGLSYLADVARLDWALNVAFHAPNEPRLSDADLATWPQEYLPKLSFRLPAGSSLVESAWPIDLIWQASQPGTPVDRVDLAAGPARLVVFRRCEDAAFAVLAPGEAVFIKCLSRGNPLATAAQHAAQAQSDFDLATTFGRMLGLRLLGPNATT